MLIDIATLQSIMLLDIVWLSAVIALLTGERDAFLIVTPLNTAVIKGTELSIVCSTNTTNTTIKPIWRTQLDQIPDDSTLFDGKEFVGQFARHYKLREDVGPGVSLVMNATEETSRRYTCEEPGYQSASAELIVLASEPICSLVEITAETDYFQAKMECAVSYLGNWSPTMAWTQSSETVAKKSDGLARIRESVRTVSDNGTLKSFLTITGTRREELLVYNCTTSFNLDQKPAYTTAANIPDYVYTWSSPAITVSPGKLIHSRSFWPMIAIVAILAVALAATSTCVLILKRKLNGHKTLLLEREGTNAKANKSELVSVSRIELSDRNISQQEKLTDLKNCIQDTGDNYECIETAVEHYLELNAHEKTIAKHEYMALTENTKCATEIHSSRSLEKGNAISDGQQNMDERHEDIVHARETTAPSENSLLLTPQTRPITHQYLELIDDTASNETPSNQKTRKAHNNKSAKRINLDFSIPILDETNY